MRLIARILALALLTALLLELAACTPCQIKNQNSMENQVERTVAIIKRNRTGGQGFASMDRELQRDIAKQGGLAISKNKAHMAEIGRKGGAASGKIRANKADITHARSIDNSSSNPS